MKEKMANITLVLAVMFLILSYVQSYSNETFEYSVSSKNATDLNDTGKHEFLLKCPSFHLEPGEYVMFSNGTVYVEPYNKTYNESFYILTNSILTICAPEIPLDDNQVSLKHMDQMTYVTEIGLGISMVCLLLHLIMFCLVPDLRNQPGCNLASLCLSLLFGYAFLIVSHDDNIVERTDICVAAACLTQFFLLGSFLWMSVMAFDVFRSLILATSNLRTVNTQFKLKKFLRYCLFSWGIALFFMLAAITADHIEGVPELYRPMFRESCWFEHKNSLLVFFAAPVFVVICVDFILFGLSTYTILTNKMKSDSDSLKSVLKENYLLYFRLAVIMGVTWITGVLASVVDTEWLWYLFAALNTLQGLFIFLAFTCVEKVKSYFRMKADRRPSQQTLSPTFQSYCFYANSIEKDLDKVVDKGKEKSDMIIIHL